MNLGNLFRTAHAFGAGFVFTIGGQVSLDEVGKSDTSATQGQTPYYPFESLDQLTLPEGCALVGIELVEGAAELPSFQHPRRAAYVLGPERGSLSPALMEKCDHLVQIPTRFCVNLATAGAIVMYDRLIALAPFGRRPVVPGGPVEAPPAHAFGQPRRRTAGRKGRQGVRG